MPAAERLYYDDSFLRTFSATVTDIREYARTDGQSLWQIALDRTAFYPTSGGQPFDRGTLTALARSGAELVAEIDEVVEDEEGEVWHSTRKPLLAGTEVTGAIDWPRRLDHMQQHTGQHLLSAVLLKEWGALTVSFHLGESVSTIDLDAPSAEEQAHLLASLVSAEERVNQHIADNLQLAARTVSAEDAQALLAAGKLRKLPPRGGPIRLVEIPGLDLNACGGTHVGVLGQIGGLLIRGTERTRKALRVEFVCGLRAVAAARRDYVALSSTAAALSVGSQAVPSVVERLLVEGKASAKSETKLREDLTQYHAAQLAVEERIDGGLRLIQRSFTNRDAAYVRLLASSVGAAVPQTVALFLSTMQEPATLVLACSQSLHCACGDRLRTALAQMDLRGGGSPDLAYTTLPRPQAEALAASLAATLVTDLRKP